MRPLGQDACQEAENRLRYAHYKRPGLISGTGLMVNLINLDLVQGGGRDRGPSVQHGGGSVMVRDDFSSWDHPDGEELQMC